MANLDSGNLISSIRWAYAKKAAFESAKKGLAVATLLLMVISSGWAQEIDSSVLQAEAAARKANQDSAAATTQAAPAQASAPQTSSAQTTQTQPQTPNSAYVLPPGTKLPLGLLRPLRVKPGQDVYLQITFPVTVGNQMLIPPGAYVQGIVQHVIKKDRRSLQFAISSANLIFSNGYTVSIGGTMTVGTTNAALAPSQPASQSVPALAAVGGLTPPPLPPLPSSNGVRNAMIGVGVSAAVGTTVLIVLAHNRDPEIEVGTPLEIILSAPVYLDATRVAAAIQLYDQQTSNAPVQIVQPPVKPPQPRMCYAPGTPGTPDTVIPGHPGTPDTVIPGVNGMPGTVIPGTPATPDTVIPGTPGTPGSWHECP